MFSHLCQNSSKAHSYSNSFLNHTKNHQILVIYSKSTDSNKGYAKVGTVSGTSISFGSETAFESATDVLYKAIEFDSSVNKVVIAYDYTETDL